MGQRSSPKGPAAGLLLSGCYKVATTTFPTFLRHIATLKFKTLFFSYNGTFSQCKHLIHFLSLLWIKYVFIRFTAFCTQRPNFLGNRGYKCFVFLSCWTNRNMCCWALICLPSHPAGSILREHRLVKPEPVCWYRSVTKHCLLFKNTKCYEDTSPLHHSCICCTSQ